MMDYMFTDLFTCVLHKCLHVVLHLKLHAVVHENYIDFPRITWTDMSTRQSARSARASSPELAGKPLAGARGRAASRSALETCLLERVGELLVRARRRAAIV